MKSFIDYLYESKSFSENDAKALGDSLDVDWSKVKLKEFVMGLEVESEHDDGELDVVNSQKDLARIVLAHLKEVPDYYTKLKSVEEDAPANSIAGGGIAGINEPFRRTVPILKRRVNKNIKEDQNKERRIQFIKSLTIKPGESDLTDKELKDFANRSRINIGSSPAMISVKLDLNAMGPNRLKQVISHPRVHVFIKHAARKLLSGEWKELPVEL